MANILFAHSVGVIGGAERVTIDIIRGLYSNHTISLICPPGELKDKVKNVVTKNIESDFFQPDWRYPLRSLVTQLKLRSELLASKPDIIHCGDILAIRFISHVANRLNVPLICHVHYPYDLAFMNWGFSKANISVFIYCSEELCEKTSSMLAKLCPTAEHKVVHNGVDLAKFSPAKNNLSDHINIGIVGNLQERKGHIDFIDMAALVLKSCKNVSFHIIGGDILGEKRLDLLKDYAISLEVSDNIIFHGQLDDVSKVISTLDIVVCASHIEAFPLTILEAMASQKAIVTTNVNGIPEATGPDGENALLVPPHNPQALAKHCIDLILDPEKRLKLALNARIRVENKFSSQIFINNIHKVYSTLL